MISVGGMRGFDYSILDAVQPGLCRVACPVWSNWDNNRLMRVVLLTPSSTSETMAFSMREMMEGIHIPREEEIQDLDAYRVGDTGCR